MKASFLGELFGTAFLLMIVVGSGIMGQSLSGGNEAIALLANALATGAGLFSLIKTLGSVSGAHFNPVVSLIEYFWGRLTLKNLISYWIAQITGAVIGVFLTHIMFNQEIFQLASKNRNEPHLWISEIVATFGLICTIALSGKKNVEFAPLSIALYIVSAYWFTSSTSFANPAVTIARALTNTFCGIAPNGILSFILAQVVGAVLAYLLLKNFEENTSK
jgi:glycerol uptake facilitator-like aquaporin